MNVYIYTLGCRLNQAESEAIAERFQKNGFVLSPWNEADLVIVNSCTVTAKAEQKARRMIRKFAERSEVIVTGCYAELESDEVRSLSGKVTVFSLKEKASLLSLPSHLVAAISSGMSLKEAIGTFTERCTDLFAFDASSFQYHSRAYLKIQDGCDNCCGYCRTTVARGPSVSLSPDAVVRRALDIEARGFHEILGALGSGMRLRLSSMEPDHVDDRLLDTLADHRMQPHFHIPIQSASEKVLAIASRRYSIDHVEHIIERMRNAKDDPFIACDVIAGLPGEGNEEFIETYDFIERNDFSAMHVFPYSPRPGTPLYGMKNRAEERVRDERAEILRKLSAVHSRRYLERQKGKKIEILVENGSEGTTGNYLKGSVSLPDGKVPVRGMIYEGILSSIDPVIIKV